MHVNKHRRSKHMNKRYDAVLDVFALVVLYPMEAEALKRLTIETALRYLHGKAKTADLTILLRLAIDLGYLEEELYAYYLRGFA